MKAAILETPKQFVLGQVETPACPSGGVLVKVSSCSICSSDARMVINGHSGLVYPRILGHELSGVIEESQSELFKPRDRVQIYPGISCGRCSACRRGETRRCIALKTLGFSEDGGFAEYLALPATTVTTGGVNLVPENVTDEEAAMTEPLASCLNAQEKAKVGRGDSVLIIGGGPLGLLHSRLSRLRGAQRVFIAEKDENRLRLASEHGEADRIIDNSIERLPKIIGDETGGRGVDVVILSTNSTSTANLLPLLADAGRLSLFASLSKESSSIWFDINQVHYRELEVTGAFGSTAVQNTAALKLISHGMTVADLITMRISLGDIVEGIHYTLERKGLRAVINFNQ
ncbi:MAG: alcohol dehydrogenase catalytic domain-containing protein [Dehalogenimonas sp.]